LEELTGQYYPNFVEFDRLLHEAHEPYMGVPHDFLGVVGAHPVVQRQGNLRSLMAVWLSELDRQGRGSYLEAAEPYLVPVYEKFGYRRTDRIIQLPNCQMFPMWREPGVAGDIASPSDAAVGNRRQRNDGRPVAPGDRGSNQRSRSADTHVPLRQV
jgi:hypothetical protein